MVTTLINYISQNPAIASYYSFAIEAKIMRNTTKNSFSKTAKAAANGASNTIVICNIVPTPENNGLTYNKAANVNLIPKHSRLI